MKRTLALLLCLAPAVALAAKDRPHFDSHPVDQAITIDGDFADWKGNAGNLEPFGEASIAIQALNDGTYLYVRLSASDPGVRSQIVRRGLTVWFDPGGGTKKVFGVRYPVIEDPGGQAGIGGYNFGRRTGGGGSTTTGGDSGTAQPDDAQPPPDRVDILGPGKHDEVSLTRDSLPGVDVAYKVEDGLLQYELKVPLVKTSDNPYSIGTASGKTIGIGLETPKPQQRSSLGGGPGGGGGFGGGGFGGGRGGFGRGGMGGGRRGGGEGPSQSSKPLNGWGTIGLK